MAPNLQILFNNNSNVYFPGQKISGHIQVINDRVYRTEGIVVTFVGKCKVFFSEVVSVKVDGKTERQNKRFQQKEEYYKNKYFAWKSADEELKEGTLKVPFEFVLPYAITASFQSPYGYVRHQMKVQLKLTGAPDVKEFRPFSVNTVLDLNKDPGNVEAQIRQDMKTLCCWCCKSGPIEAQVHLDHTGYVPGQQIRISADITNGSNRVIDGSRAQLVMIVQYLAQGHTKTCEYKIRSSAKGPIAPHQEGSWKDERLEVPPLAPSELHNCKLINVNYKLKFIVDPSGMSFDLVLEFPVVIGTIPIRQAFNNFRSFIKRDATDVGFASAPPKEILPDLLDYPELPPPSYAMACAEDTMATGGEFNEKPNAYEGFTPLYAFYNTAESQEL